MKGADIERFVKIQQITYWCATVNAKSRFSQITSINPPKIFKTGVLENGQNF